MTRAIFLFPLLLTACPADKDSADTAGGTGNPDGTCEIEVDETIPADGAVDAYYRGWIEFHLDDPDPTATIETDIPGTQDTNEDGDVIYWIPSEPLAPSTAYTATLHYCGGDPEISFTTSSLGTAVAPEDLLERTYALDLQGARIVEPDGIGSVLTSQLTQQILVGVQTADATSIQMIGAIGAEGSDPPVQGYCDPTIPFPAADFDGNPFFSIGPEDTTLSVAGYDIEIGQLEITGTFAPDGSYFGGGTLSGTIDTRPLAPLLDESGDPNAICELAINFGAECQACPSDNEPYCLTLVADQIDAEEVAGLTLKEVAGNECTDCASWTQDTVPPVEEQVCPE